MVGKCNEIIRSGYEDEDGDDEDGMRTRRMEAEKGEV